MKFGRLTKSPKLILTHLMRADITMTEDECEYCDKVNETSRKICRECWKELQNQGFKADDIDTWLASKSLEVDNLNRLGRVIDNAKNIVEEEVKRVEGRQ